MNVAVSKRVKQYFLSGGCTRDFSSTCPIGWTYAGGLCSAPAGAATPCKDLDLRNAKEHDLAPRADVAS